MRVSERRRRERKIYMKYPGFHLELVFALKPKLTGHPDQYPQHRFGPSGNLLARRLKMNPNLISNATSSNVTRDVQIKLAHEQFCYQMEATIGERRRRERFFLGNRKGIFQ